MILPHDMSDILNDPDWSQSLTVRRAVRFVNDFGRTEESVDTFQITAVTEPADPETVMRLPEADRGGEYLMVRTGTPLQPSTDTVLTGGEQYRVVHVKDFSIYGYVEVLSARISTGVKHV